MAVLAQGLADEREEDVGQAAEFDLIRSEDVARRLVARRRVVVTGLSGRGRAQEGCEGDVHVPYPVVHLPDGGFRLVKFHVRNLRAKHEKEPDDRAAYRVRFRVERDHALGG